MIPVAALFVRRDSIYKTMEGVDCYDEDRDARNWSGGCPVVAHPPCRAWGAFAMFAKPRHDEKDMARWAVRMVREFGGVLEHPYRSNLWSDMNLPEPNECDGFGGWTLPVHQHWWGHLAEKATRLYIVGIRPRDIPTIPMRLDEPTHVIGDVGRAGFGNRPEISKADRERTPPDFARWLVELARRCVVTPTDEPAAIRRAGSFPMRSA